MGAPVTRCNPQRDTPTPRLLIPLLRLAALVLLPASLWAQERQIVFHIFFDGQWKIEPIAEYRFGRFQQAVAFSDDDAESNGELRAFALDYFQKGTNYQLIHRNERMGLVQIDSPLVIGAVCSPRFSGLDSLRLQQSAVALTENIGLRRKMTERECLKSDTASVLAAARSFLRTEEKGAFGKSTLEVSSMNAVDLDGDGVPETIGTVRASHYYPRASGIPNKHRTVAVITSNTTMLYAAVIGTDEETGSLVDVIDLDGDGIMEIILVTTAAHRRYHILRRESTWRSVYEGRR